VIDLRQLHYFLAIAEAGNFHRAAQRVHISQPALSQRMKALEEALAVALFVRTPRGVTLTPAGETFVRGARQVLRDLDLAIAGTRLANRDEHGSITIAFNEMGGQQPIVGRCLELFRSAFPNVNVRLLEMGKAAQHEALREGSIDAGFHFSLLDEPPEFAIERVESRAFGLVVPESHPLAGKAVVAMSDLRDQPMVLLEREVNLDTHKGIVGAFARAGIPLSIAAHASSDAGLLTLVRAGFGLAIVMIGPRRGGWDGLSVLPVEGLDLAKDFVLAFNPGNRLPLLAKFIAMLRDTLYLPAARELQAGPTE